MNDTSLNGTFVNGTLVGKGNEVPVSNGALANWRTEVLRFGRPCLEPIYGMIIAVVSEWMACLGPPVWWLQLALNIVLSGHHQLFFRNSTIPVAL